MRSEWALELHWGLEPQPVLEWAQLEQSSEQRLAQKAKPSG